MFKKLSLIAAVAVVLALFASATNAATGGPDPSTPDADGNVAVYVWGQTYLNVLTDEDHYVCRGQGDGSQIGDMYVEFGNLVASGYEAGVFEGSYRLCDWDITVPEGDINTLTVMVVGVDSFVHKRVKKIVTRKGKVRWIHRFTNPNLTSTTGLSGNGSCDYGSFSQPQPDGWVDVMAGSVEKVKSPRKNLDYMCYMWDGFAYAGDSGSLMSRPARGVNPTSRLPKGWQPNKMASAPSRR